jgi:hypothetical protein
MTVKQALEFSISKLRKQRQTEEIKEVIEHLEKLQRRDLVAHWTQESIVEALNHWEKEHGMPPTVTSLVEPGMPGSNIIQKHFGMKASAFLRQMYPGNYKRHTPENKYGYTTQEEWVACFREQFLKHCNSEGFCSRKYNLLRDEGTPRWETISLHCDNAQWKKLMELADVRYPNRPRTDGLKEFRVITISPLVDRIEKAVAERERLNQEFFARWDEKERRENERIKQILAKRR